MAFTSRLATDRSKLAAIKLAADEPEQNLNQNVSHTIVFVQSATPNFVEHEKAESHTLVFIQTATVEVHRSRSVLDTLNLVQQVTGNFFFENVSHSIPFVQSATTLGPKYEQVVSGLQLQQTVNGHLGVINISVEDNLALADVMGRQIPQSVSHTITFTDTAVNRYVFVDTLNFIQSASGGKGKTVEQSVTFAHAIATQNVFLRSLSSPMTLTHAASYLIVNDCTELNYTPFVGASTDASYTPPTTTVPTLGNALLTLTYPFVSPTSTLVLRNPRFGNRDRLIFSRINRETRGGTLVVFADPQWPKIQQLSLTLGFLKQQQIVDLEAFLAASLGKEIGLKDWENRQWRGIITNPDTELSHDSPGDRGVVLEFEGVLA